MAAANPTTAGGDGSAFSRCHYNAVSDPSVHAIVTVYSSGRDVDKGAALGLCKAHEASYP